MAIHAGQACHPLATKEKKELQKEKEKEVRVKGI
jgi:hypothetical protein